MKKYNFERSAKSLEALHLLDRMIQVELTRVSFEREKFSTVGRLVKVRHDFFVCLINGELYTRPYNFEYYLRGFVERRRKTGEIAASEFLHCRVLHRPNVLIKFTALKDLKEEMRKYAAGDIDDIKWYLDRMFSFLTQPLTMKIKEYHFTEETLSESESAYSSRIQLLREVAEERHEERQRQEEEESQARQERAAKAAEARSFTLNELVSRIEAMGWEVMLRLRSTVEPGGSAEKNSTQSFS